GQSGHEHAEARDLRIDVGPDGHPGNRLRHRVGFGRRDRLAADSHRVLDVEVVERVLNLADGFLYRRQYLVLVDQALFVEGDQFELRVEGVRGVGAVPDLVPHVPADLAAAARDVHGDRARVLDLEVEDPDLASGVVDVLGLVLDVDLPLNVALAVGP